MFITIEDETGIANLVIWPDVFEAQRKVVMGARLMTVHGVIQREKTSSTSSPASWRMTGDAAEPLRIRCPRR